MTETQQHTRPPELVGLIDRQIDLYATLDELSRRQHTIVETDDTDALLDVLARRQAVIDQISQLSAQLTPYRPDWEQHVAELPDTERSRIRKRLDDLAVVMEQIARRDELDRDVMEQRRASVSAELGGVRRGGAAVSAYAGVSKGPRFQDRKA